MIHRIYIFTTVPDTRAHAKIRHLNDVGFNKITDLKIIDIYVIDKILTKKQITKCAQSLYNPVSQKTTIDSFPFSSRFQWYLEIGFLPGVTDNLATTTRELIEDLLKVKFRQGEGIYTSQIILLRGKLQPTEISVIAETLINPLIHRTQVFSRQEFLIKKNEIYVPRVKLRKTRDITDVNLDIPDEKLIRLGKLGIVNADGSRRGPLSLNLNYLKKIRLYFEKQGRKPTDVELESIAQTWSEHCKHTIFADPIDEIKDGLFKTYIKGATDKIRKKLDSKDFCVSVFTDNSGAVKFDKNYLITHKVETHNSPSALDPFGGAVTGIVGVNRDCIGFGLGSKPIANTFGFCVGSPNDKKLVFRDDKRTQPLFTPRRILDGIIAGVNSGGNCSGIPTPQGFVYINDRYKGKPLVFVGTVGLLPKTTNGKKLYQKKARSGDYIVMVGGRVGLDGIHGATFSSEALTSGSPQTAVQIGDPITQKKFSDALIKEARDQGLYHSITDNGAGGLSCSVAEMAKESGGCLVNLEKVPVKYPGLAPWQMWISESQERMTLAVPKVRWRRFKKLCNRRGIEATVIGMFTSSGRAIVKYGRKTVMDLSMDFLHSGLPRLPQKSQWMPVKHEEPKTPRYENWTNVVITMMRRPNIASFAWISGQFDHEVQGTSVVKPLEGRGLVNGEASVIRPILSSNKGIVLTQAVYPSYGDIDPYVMAAAAIDTAVRNAIATGADPEHIALLDNFCWCSGHDPKRLGQLKRAAMACYDTSIAYRTPFISGKDSMFNDFSGFDENSQPVNISIPPTLLISAVGVIPDMCKSVSMDIKMTGDLIYLLGDTDEELGASEYYLFLSESQGGRHIGNRVPQVDTKKNKKLYYALSEAIQLGLVASTQSVTHGGLIVALVKSAIAGQLGMDISLRDFPGDINRDDYALFSESQGRVVVTVDPEKKRQFESTMRDNSCQQIGRVTKVPTVNVVGLTGKQIVHCSLQKLTDSYRSTFKEFNR